MLIIFFRGLILAPDELRTNSERTLALSFFLELIFFSVLNFLGFGRTKTLELQLVDAFFVQIQCYQGKKIIETCFIQVFHATKTAISYDQKRASHYTNRATP